MSHIFDTNTFSGWEVEHGPADLVLTVQQLDSAD